MIDLLKSKKLRVTDFRLAVLKVFMDSKAAISLSQIEKALGDFDRITLYRTLKSFKAKGLIHEISLGEEKKLALCEEDCHEKAHHHEHVHFQCNNCHEVYCVDVPKIPDISLKGFKVDRVEMQVFGICSSCS
ncbi:transcriptional repressor [Paracrocinitomix mangrovi]|uniref:Fur family transcriptional regulator n=1 Tax=Paracrocinitomix mangrovi TaxID=2862509 RepID=UPI001C8EFE8B|nr:transcriptional repressor [Paracrocinitomix mangrovi]UKN03678.1 transcriptional repressor [Paracrocinitomix mangrovi]